MIWRGMKSCVRQISRGYYKCLLVINGGAVKDDFTEHFRLMVNLCSLHTCVHKPSLATREADHRVLQIKTILMLVL